MELLVREQLCPSNKYNIKAPYTMTAEYITVHNTANDASAKSEVAYMLNNNKNTSFHVAVDDVEAILAIPLNRTAWHAGDGANGTGNRKTIGIEICYSKSGGSRFDKAEQNAAYLIAKMLIERNWGIERVKKHQDWSNKRCPHRTLDKGWDRFINMIKENMDNLNKPKLTASGVYVVSNNNNGITAGLVTDAKNKNDVEYSWYVSIDCQNWAELEGWEAGDEWVSWKPYNYGSYIILGKARYKDSKEIVSSYTVIEYHPCIKGNCQDIIDGRFMLGVEIYENLGYVAEIQIYDCHKQAWIYGTGKCVIDDTSLWTSVELDKNNNYWALYRIYKDDILVDEKCCGFTV